jgi:hypothetical protein
MRAQAAPVACLTNDVPTSGYAVHQRWRKCCLALRNNDRALNNCHIRARTFTNIINGPLTTLSKYLKCIIMHSVDFSEQIT